MIPSTTFLQSPCACISQLRENLARPAHWCNKQWQWVKSPLEGNVLTRLGSILLRLSAIIPLTFMTLAAYCLKALALERIERTVSTAPGLFESLPQDILIYAFTFVERDDLRHLSQVSKTIRKAADADALWFDELASKRIWGPGRHWNFVQVREGYEWQTQNGETDQTRLMAKQQIGVYESLIKRGHFEDLIVRQIPGGPIAYKNLPILQVDNHRLSSSGQLSIRPEEVTAPIMRGVINGLHFIAIRFCNHADESQGQQRYVEVFVEQEMPSRPPSMISRLLGRNEEESNPLSNWQSSGNGYFPAGNLQDHDMQYLIRLIRREPCGNRPVLGNASHFEQPIPEGLRTVLELV